MTDFNRFYQEALKLDREDELAGFRMRFSEREDLVYLDGNSLGRLPQETELLVGDLIRKQWGERLIRSWNENWMGLSSRLAGKIAQIIGAREDEVFVGDTTSLNLYKLAWASLAARQGRKGIVSDETNFPSDLYVLQGLVDKHFKDHQIHLVKSKDGISADTSELELLINHNTALLTLSYVAFKSSFMYDMKEINDLAHRNGAMVIWDLSHAAGAVPVNLNKTGADMAVGCTYKYLNGGPGAPAFLYVRKELQEELQNPVSSWFSHDKPFDFDSKFVPAEGIKKFAVSTPSVISLAAIEPGLDLIIEAGIDNLRSKSQRQGAYLMDMVNELLVPRGFSPASPAKAEQRGSHVSLRHPDGYRINRAMIDPEGDALPIIPDFRPPDNIRLGIAPLYNSFMDLYYAVERIIEIVENREHERFGSDKPEVI